MPQIRTTLMQALENESIASLGANHRTLWDQIVKKKSYLSYSETAGWRVRRLNLLEQIFRDIVGFFACGCSPFADTHLNHIFLHQNRDWGALSADKLQELDRKMCGVWNRTYTRHRVGQFFPHEVVQGAVRPPIGMVNDHNSCWFHSSMMALLPFASFRRAIANAPLVEGAEGRAIIARLKEVLQVYDTPPHLYGQVSKERVLQILMGNLRRDVWESNLVIDYRQREGHAIDSIQDASLVYEALLPLLHIPMPQMRMERELPPPYMRRPPEVHETNFVNLSRPAGPITLEQLLQNFPVVHEQQEGGIEIDGQQVPYFETSCMEAPLPDILPVRIKRYDNFGQRIDVPVSVDDRQQWDLSCLTMGADPGARYTLSGFLVQSGSGAAGHYQTIRRMGGQWVLFNNQFVTPLSDRSLLDKGYIYLFERVAT